MSYLSKQPIFYLIEYNLQYLAKCPSSSSSTQLRSVWPKWCGKRIAPQSRRMTDRWWRRILARWRPITRRWKGITEAAHVHHLLDLETELESLKTKDISPLAAHVHHLLRAVNALESKVNNGPSVNFLNYYWINQLFINENDILYLRIRCQRYYDHKADVTFYG